MFSNLENFLNFNTSSPPNGKSILITERGADGSFMLHHLIATYLKGGHNVCLIGLAQTFTHYSSVASKFSLNLAASRDSGQLVFVDALGSIGSEIVQRSNDGKCSDSHLEGLRPVRSLLVSAPTESRQSLRNFYEAVKSALDKLSDWKTKPVLLVADDLSLLVLLGYSPFSVSVLVQYLKLLVCPSENSLGAFASLIHSDPSASDEEVESLQKLVGHGCQQLIYVDSLKTGYCREVTGEVTIECRDLSKGNQEKETKRMHFKIADKALALFPLGMSTAVL